MFPRASWQSPESPAHTPREPEYFFPKGTHAPALEPTPRWSPCSCSRDWLLLLGAPAVPHSLPPPPCQAMPFFHALGLYLSQKELLTLPFHHSLPRQAFSVPGPAGPGGWPGGRGSPHLIPSDGSVQHLPLLSARSLRGGPEPLGASCPPGLALPELVACPGPWKRSSVWPLSHTQDRVKTWRRPASAPAFLPGDGRQLSPRGQASPAQSGPHGLRRDWPVWSQSTPSSFHPLWPTYHLKQGLWGGTQGSAFHHGPALRLGTIRSRILGHSGCLASVIVRRGQ